MLRVIDHTERVWESRYQKRYRENGAATYSRDTIAHQIPLWREWAADREVLISTCPLLLKVHGEGDVAVQYLHEYRYEDPLARPRAVRAALERTFDRVIFVTAYRELSEKLQQDGLEALYLPMSVDTQALPQAPQKARYPRQAAYFGNVTSPKRELYEELHKTFSLSGWTLRDIKDSNQHRAWEKLAPFDYGVGVGRCALEMGALGMRVMIAGTRFGGIITSEQEWQAQHETNMNGRIYTYSDSITKCIQDWNAAQVGLTCDVSQTLPILREHLEKL